MMPFKEQKLRFKRIKLIIVTALLWVASHAYHQDEITEFGDTVIYLGCNGGSNQSLVRDYDVNTGVLVPDSTPELQCLEVNWSGSGPRNIGGVLFHTDEAKMTSGEIKFYVNDVECPDTGGVGLNAKGGVFNCNLEGTVFKAICTSTCSPNFSVNEVKLWKKTALSALGTHYFLEGNEIHQTYGCEPEKVYQVGSYVTGSWQDACTISKGTASTYSTFFIELPDKAVVKNVIAITIGSHYNNILLLSMEKFEDPINFDDSYIVADYTGQEFPAYLTRSMSVDARHFGNVRQTSQTHWAKFIVIGDLCDDQSDLPLDAETWDQPGQWKVKQIGESTTFEAPTYSYCGDPIDNSQLDVTFFNAVTGASINWVTYDSLTHRITVTSTTMMFSTYSNTDVWVGIQATDSVSTKSNNGQSFNIYIDDYIRIECGISQLPQPEDIEEVFTVQVYEETDQVVQLETLVDSGTQILQSTSGYETASCGPIKYRVNTLFTLVSLDENTNELSFYTEDKAMVGQEQKYEIEAYSEDYPNEIASVRFYGKVTVLPCEVLELLEPEEARPFSPLIPVFSLPNSFKINLPLFEPIPSCGLSNDDLTYKIETELPPWATFDDKKREIDVAVEDTAFKGTTWPMLAQAKLEGITVDIPFAISFIDNSQKPVPQTVEEEPEPEEETEEEDPEPQPVTTGWDGWKSLLNFDTLIPGGLVLPPPKTDPNYVPTPPVATLEKITAKGEAEIKFNEAVFEYPDLQNMRIPKAFLDLGRKLQEGEDSATFTVDDSSVETVQFVSVTLEYDDDKLDDPDFDPKKLEFDYEIKFSNPFTIEIKVKWKDPPYISANLPEDTLVVKFNGPIFDRQDGLDIKSNLKTLRRKIPPQVVPGGLTDAIESSGGSLQITSTSAMASNAAINIFLAGSLNQLWGMVNNMQIVIHSPLIAVQFPANAQIVYSVMVSVATFDFLPTDDFYPYFFPNLPENDGAYLTTEGDDSIERFDRMQFGSNFLVMNMGTLFIFFTFQVVLYLVYPIFKFLKDDTKCGAKYTKKIKPMIFWNNSILFFQEGFLDFMLIGMINWVYLQDRQFSWSTGSLIFTNLLTIFVIGSCTALFLFITCYLWPKFSKLRSKKLKDKFHPAYEMINLRHGHWTMLWPILFMLRRVVFAFAVCILYEKTSIQIFSLMIPTLLVLVLLLAVQPLQGGLPVNNLETYNAITLLALCYCIMTFTPFGSEPGAKYTIGYIAVLITCQNILVNIIVISKDPVRIMFIKCKIKWAKRAQIKQRWSLKMQKTKLFFSQKFSKASKNKNVEDSDQMAKKLSNKLDTIGEVTFESLESADELEIKAQLAALGIESKNFATKNRSMKEIEDQIIAQLNAQALQKLDERAQARLKQSEAERHKVEEVVDRFKYGVGQNPKLTKYKLPNIEDLLSFGSSLAKQRPPGQVRRQAHEFEITQQSRTRSNLQRKANELISRGSSQFEQPDSDEKIRQFNRISLGSFDEDSNDYDEDENSEIAVHKPHGDKRVRQGATLDDKMRKTQRHVPPKGSFNKTAANQAWNYSDQVDTIPQTERQLMASTVVPGAKQGGWTGQQQNQGRLFETRRVFEEEPEVVIDTSAIDQTQIQLLTDLTPQPLKEDPAALGQTTRMADGQNVLFPELYKKTFGVDVFDQNAPHRKIKIPQQQAATMNDYVRVQDTQKMSKKEKSKRKKRPRSPSTTNSLFQSEKTSIVAPSERTEFEEVKDDLRHRIMQQFTQGYIKSTKTVRRKESKAEEADQIGMAPSKGKQKALRLFEKGLKKETSSETESSDSSEVEDQSDSQFGKSANATAASRRLRKTVGLISAIEKIKSQYEPTK